jgi:TM2 domain-containing membrane protein YozV
VNQQSEKKKTTAVLLWLISMHRFYVGKFGTGILYILTAGGCGIWVIYDFIQILRGQFTDKHGNLIAA